MIDLGAAGTFNAHIISFMDLMPLIPQPDQALTLILSVLIAAALERYLMRITLELEASPESTTTPLIPPIEVGKVHK